jgi:hypothetical protein
MGPAALIDAVAVREYRARAGRAAAVTVAVAAGAALVGMAGCRLLGGPVEWCGWPLLAAPPVAGLVVALIRARKPGRGWAARQVDGKLGRDDLMRTWLDLGSAPGAYQEIVREQAEAAAKAAQPHVIRPFSPRTMALRAGVSFALLAIALAVVPVEDPFGLGAERKRIAEREKVLAAQIAEAKAHAADLRAKDPERPVSEGTAQSLAKLAATLDALKTGAPPEANKAELAQEQKLLAQDLLQAQATAFKPESSDDQALGGQQQQAGKQLSDALAAGDAQKVQQAMAELKKAADRLAEARDPAAQEQARQDLQKKLEAVQQALGHGNPAAGRTVQDALDQLAQAGNPQGGKAAQEALNASLDLLDAQMQNVARGARDAQALKDALATEKMARQLDQMGGLPDAGKGMSLAEYARKYQEMLDRMAQGGGGKGKGKGGKGGGKGDGKDQGDGNDGEGGVGGKATYNDKVDTGFTPERSPTQMGPGEILMQWKTIGPSEAGTVDARYQDATAQVRQEASEALMHEDLPPSARDAAKRYFDGMGAGAAGAPAPPAGGVENPGGNAHP